MYYKISYDDELAHHGILGQKWGVRRYQNEDGTLTEAGKQRYSSDIDAKQKASEERKRMDSKNRGTLTDAQLQKKIQRLKLEKELRELTDSEVNSGRKVVQDTLVNIGKQVATTAVKGAVLYAVKAAISREFNAKDLAVAVFNGGAKKK